MSVLAKALVNDDKLSIPSGKPPGYDYLYKSATKYSPNGPILRDGEEVISSGSYPEGRRFEPCSRNKCDMDGVET